MMVGGSHMAEASSDKPTLLSRLFGRKLDDPPAKPEEKAGEVSAKTSARTSVCPGSNPPRGRSSALKN